MQRTKTECQGQKIQKLEQKDKGRVKVLQWVMVLSLAESHIGVARFSVAWKRRNDGLKSKETKRFPNEVSQTMNAKYPGAKKGVNRVELPRKRTQDFH